MAMQNWWMRGSFDNKSTRINTGTRGKDGGFNLYINQKVGGVSKTALHIQGHSNEAGLVLAFEYPTHLDLPGLRVYQSDALDRVYRVTMVSER